MVFCVAQAGLKPARSSAFASSVQTTAPVISLPFRRKGFQTGSAINYSHPSSSILLPVFVHTRKKVGSMCALRDQKFNSVKHTC